MNLSLVCGFLAAFIFVTANGQCTMVLSPGVHSIGGEAMTYLEENQCTEECLADELCKAIDFK